ncbi:MAG: hypothetical protein Q9M13_04290, partial [Mariprofundales bacterium]|nr:hypothetical protein [Mariprofundales bacterium]
MNTVLSADVTTDKSIVIPKGAVTDQFGTTNIAAVTWDPNTTLASVLSQAAAGSLSSSGLFTLNTALTPSSTATTAISAGNIYAPAQTSITNATTTIANGILPTTLYAKNSSNGVKVNSNGQGATLSADALTALGSASITFPAGTLQDSKGVVNAADVVWPANTKLSTSVNQNASNKTMATTGIYTLVGNTDLLLTSSPVTTTPPAAITAAGSLLPTLNPGATLTAATTIQTGSGSLTIPQGTLRDQLGAVNGADIVIPADSATTLGALAVGAGVGLSGTGPYTLLATNANANSAKLAAGSVTNSVVMGTLNVGTTLTAAT